MSPDPDAADALHPATRALHQALGDLRHERSGFYGPALRGQLLATLSVPLRVRSYRVLRSLRAGVPAGLTVSQVAEVLLADRARASRVVDELVELGLVQRRADPGDRRRRVVLPTERGDALLDEAAALRASRLRAVTATWAEQDVARLAELLGRFNDDVRTLGG